MHAHWLQPHKNFEITIFLPLSQSPFTSFEREPSVDEFVLGIQNPINEYQITIKKAKLKKTGTEDGEKKNICLEF